MSETKTIIPEPPTDTVSGLGTVKMDIDGLYVSAQPSNTAQHIPIKMESLGVSGNILAQLTCKPSDKYKFRKSIGQGGMKVVIQVKDRDTMRDIAMAILPDAQTRPQKEILRFIEEARITASLEHPNIVPVHDIGVDVNGSPYFTMKLIKGETLAAVLRKLQDNDPEYMESYTLDKLLLIYVKICNGIAFAHSKGVLHLDLKPENIQVGDYGEVIIMDWGLAKVISAEPQGSHSETQMDIAPNSTGEGDTIDGIRKGTPGFMAPEQAAGKNSEKDFRTDVYALGAILYSLLTFHNPLTGVEVDDMLRETVRGEIIPPSKRFPERMIPSSLEAVVMKAMAFRPADRYKAAKELRNDVLAFMSGYATRAEKATPLKKTLLFINRHKITFFSATTALLLLLITGIYAFQEVSRQHGDWIPAFQRDFQSENISLAGMSFYDPSNSKEVPEWKTISSGLKMPRGEWLRLSDTKIRENVKIVLSVLFSESETPLDVSINSSFNRLKNYTELPCGYSFRISGYRGTMDMIMKNDQESSQEIISTAPIRIQSGKINTIILERLNEKISVTVNGVSQSTTDLFPLAGRDLDGIGFRSPGSGVILQSIAVYRLALPAKASPVVAGDALLETRHFDDAIEKYLTIADDYIRGPIAEEALAKAYATAARAIENEEERSRILIGIKRRIAARFATFAYREKLLEIDALMLWKNKNYTASLSIINDIFKKNPNSGIMTNILQQPHFPLPEYAHADFLMNLSRSKNLSRLNISGYGLRSLAPLANMRLIYLDCSNNYLTALNGIEGMPLEVLICGGNKIKSLEPLKEMPLLTLACNDNRITSLLDLDLTSLIDLNCSRNQLTSLESLRKATLERFFCRENQIRTLDPLKGMSLKHLDAGMTPVSELAPLKDMPLEILLLDGTSVSNLEPLKGMPLTVLGLYNCPKISDYTPLFGLDTLEVLSLSETVKIIPELREKLARLTLITDPGFPFGNVQVRKNPQKK